jgi:hypothetical protein
MSAFQLAIPNASELNVRNNEQVFADQKALLEKAFANLPADQSTVSLDLDLDQPLSNGFVNELVSKGYDVYQSMKYDSRDSASGRYKIKITSHDNNRSQLDCPYLHSLMTPCFSRLLF